MNSASPNSLKPLPSGCVLIIDNYDSFTYNLFQMVQAQTALPVCVVRNDALNFEAIKVLSPNRIIISPGPGHPELASDFGVCSAVIQRQTELGVPVLGVCLGHQGLASHLGGATVKAPAIVHGKTSVMTIIKPDCPLFDSMPAEFEAMRYHSLVAEELSLPDCLEVTVRDVQSGLIMGLQHKEKPLYGVQFHPESVGTPLGAVLLKNFLEKC